MVDPLLQRYDQPFPAEANAEPVKLAGQSGLEEETLGTGRVFTTTVVFITTEQPSSAKTVTE